MNGRLASGDFKVGRGLRPSRGDGVRAMAVRPETSPYRDPDNRG